MIGNQTIERHEREYEVDGGFTVKLLAWRHRGCHWHAQAQVWTKGEASNLPCRDLGPTATEATAWQAAVRLAEYQMALILAERQRVEAERELEAA